MKLADLLRVVQTVLLGLVVALLVMGADAVEVDAAVPRRGGGEPGLSGLKESVERLASALERRSVAGTAPSAARQGEERKAIPAGDPPDLDPLVAQLKRLEGVLRGVRGVTDRTPAVASMRTRYAKTDWARLKVLYRKYVEMSNNDKEQDFKRDFLLLSLTDVLRQFGKPTEIETENSGQAWRYSLMDDKDDDTLVDLTFVISNGFVVNVY